MRIKTLAGCVIVLAHAMAAAAAPFSPPPLMMPAGPWNVEFADRMCHLSRPYGSDRATHLIFKPGMIGDEMEIIVAKTTTKTRDGTYGKAVLSISGKKVIDDALFSAYSTAEARLMRIQLRDDEFALSVVRGTLSIDAAPESHHLFVISGIERALPILAQCIDQLRTIYKVSKTDLADIATKPEGSLPRLFSTDDYPSEALRNEESGTVGALVWVETNGRISTCEIIESSGSSSLEQTTCDILKRRSRFAPAKDAAGKAVRAPMFTRIRWSLPS